jgi:hypothetical protein
MEELDESENFELLDTTDESDKDLLLIDQNESTLPVNGTSIATVLQVLLVNGLSTVFPILYIALKIGITLPIASVTTESSFSKLSEVKNKLRSTMTEDRLDSLIIIASESDIPINNNNIIDAFSTSTPLLLNVLRRLFYFYFFITYILCGHLFVIIYLFLSIIFF